MLPDCSRYWFGHMAIHGSSKVVERWSPEIQNKQAYSFRRLDRLASWWRIGASLPGGSIYPAIRSASLRTVGTQYRRHQRSTNKASQRYSAGGAVVGSVARTSTSTEPRASCNCVATWASSPHSIRMAATRSCNPRQSAPGCCSITRRALAAAPGHRGDPGPYPCQRAANWVATSSSYRTSPSRASTSRANRLIWATISSVMVGL